MKNSKITGVNDILTQLVTIKARIEQAIEERDIIFDQGSDKWQGSANGIKFDNETWNLKDVWHNVNLAITCVNNPN